MREFAVLPAVIRHARQLVRDDQDTRACRLLSQALAAYDPVTARHDPRLIRAAMLYVEVLSFERTVADRAEVQLSWVRYAPAAALSCFGARSPVWQDTATVYARVCAAQGLTFDAALMRRRKLAAYLRYGPAECIARAWEKLAVALHTGGQCEQARVEIRDAFHYWQHTGIPGQPVGGQLLDAYAGILAGCGDTEAARTLLTDYAYLAAVPGTTDHGTAAIITAVHIAMAEREHPPVCTAPRPRPAALLPQQSSPRWQFWQAILLEPARSAPEPPHRTNTRTPIEIAVADGRQRSHIGRPIGLSRPPRPGGKGGGHEP